MVQGGVWSGKGTPPGEAGRDGRCLGVASGPAALRAAVDGGGLSVGAPSHFLSGPCSRDAAPGRAVSYFGRGRTMSAPQRPKEPTDEELVERLVAGDRSAGDSIIRRHSGLVAKAVRQAGAESKDVEDVVQDIFLRAFRKAIRYKASKGRFTSWLATVARNDALNHLRRRRTATV